MKRYFRGRKARRDAKKNRYYSFDIECAGLNPKNPLLICVVPFHQYNSRMPEQWVFRGPHCKQQFLEWLDALPTTKKNIIYSHNGSRFDIYAVFDKWGVVQAKKFDRDGRIYWIQYAPHVEFRDSAHLLKAPLRAFGAKGTTPQKFIDKNHPDFGSYDAVDDEDIEYCIQDCIVLRNAMKQMASLYSDWTNKINAELPLTTASMAHRVWSHQSWPERWSWKRKKGKNKGQSEWSTQINQSAENAAQKAYYGGRVEIHGVAGHEYHDVVSYDRNSMYPTVMLYEYPDPTSVKKCTDLDSLLDSDFLFWGRFHMVADDDAILFLPNTNDEGRRDYKTTEFDGYLCSPEVRYALENGWRVVESSDIWFATKSMRPFRQFVNQFYTMRKQMKDDNDEREVLVKLMLNALYGVFATKGHQERIENPDEIDEIMNEEGWRDEWTTHIWNTEGGEFYLLAVGCEPPPEHTCFAWAAFVTSYARVDLDSAIREIQSIGKQVVYCDTDSVHFADFNPSEPLPLSIGGELGQWQLESVGIGEGQWVDFADAATYYEPKVYTWKQGETSIKIKHKGCSMSTGDPTVPQRHESVVQYRTGIRRGIEAGVAIETTKRSKRWCK